MTISTHDLGMSYLDDMQFIAEIIHFEAYIRVPYADSKGNATIGIGVNLEANGDNYLALVLDQLGVFSTYIGQINATRLAAGEPELTTTETNILYNNIVNDFKGAIDSIENLQQVPGATLSTIGTSDSEVQLQTALNTKLQDYLNDPNATFELSKQQANAITKEIILGYTVGPYHDDGKQARLDAILGNTPTHTTLAHDSKEYMAVMSLFYNGESQVKAGGALATAIINGDRADAWFTIRYGLNKRDSNDVANRHYQEADIFVIKGTGVDFFLTN